MYHRSLSQVCKPMLPVAVVVSLILWLFVAVKLVGDVAFSTAQMTGFVLAIAKAASTMEIAIAIIGFALLVAAFIAYPGSQGTNDLRTQLSNLDTNFQSWQHRYYWFDQYLRYAKTWAVDMQAIHHGTKVDQSSCNDLIQRAILYNYKLEDVFRRVGDVEQAVKETINSIHVQIEEDYMQKARLSIILAVVGLGLIILALILPSSDTLLGVIASGMVDPSLTEQEKLNAISEMKALLKSI